MKINKLDKIEMDSLIIYSKEKGILFEEINEEKINIRSIAKFVTSLACGILIDKSNGDFNEDTLIYDILKDKVEISNKDNILKLKNISVRDCLTHTMGYRDIILMSKDIGDLDKDKLLEYALSYPLYFNPGEEFLYSNAGYYVLSATMQEYLGYDLYDFINENIFRKLGIINPRWDMYGKYLVGASKLYLKADDLLKLGDLVLNDGVYFNQRIVSSEWLGKMSSKLFKNEKDYVDQSYLSNDYYGYGLWTGKDGVTYASGSGGQYVIFLKKEGIIIVACNGENPNKVPAIKSQLNSIIKSLREVENGL
ncbi:serine hydrolase domain-containing protein [Anaerococcus degeneri]|uniref:Serine hydrolase n=1 Tax=Anaerococcus degeneri TaxID=361500 RepID=A0ABS7YUD0_9FIRM|nr:serine hydrolase [Anaerococcus degeneri]MBP2015082.1 CubicO group peptidase (beta-lactamase class C family) [Anaerococcus degeneri]MCA2095342.1 serine hydrolase [Anaerococcus degeneri]